MKIKNGVLFNNDFEQALNYFSKLPLPIKFSFPLRKCLNIFQNEEKSVKIARDELVKKYGKEIVDETGQLQGWDINKSSKENQKKFVEELNDLFNMEFDLPLDEKIKINMKEIEDIRISAEHLFAMELLVDFIN